MNLHRRPLILGSLSALATPGAIFAQQPAPGKVWRIGVLSLSLSRTVVNGVLRHMRDHGFEEGRNLTVDFRFAEGKADSMSTHAADLVATKPDLLLGPTNTDVAALKRATANIPIVMMYVSEPVETGLIASLAHPGANVTGTTTNTFEVAGKMTQILRETVPRMSSIVWLADPDYPGMASYWKFSSQAALAMNIQASLLPVRTLVDLDAALSSLARERPDGIGVSMTGPIAQHAGRIVEFAARNRLPALYSTAGIVRAGGLMSYGPNFDAVNSRIAWMIDKIFKGAKPNDIPVEEPARFTLIINMKTAKAMGLVIPPIVLLQATELIE